MRRADLVVGAELFYCRSTKWMTDTHYAKAVVVATEPYRNAHSTAWSRTPPLPVKTTKGPGVLVDLFAADHKGVLGVKGVRDVVPLTALHGPWEETLAKVQERLRAADDVTDARTKLRTDLAAMAEALISRAAQLGIRVDSREEYRHGDVLPPTRLIEVRMDEFERVLQRLEDAQ